LGLLLSTLDTRSLKKSLFAAQNIFHERKPQKIQDEKILIRAQSFFFQLFRDLIPTRSSLTGGRLRLRGGREEGRGER